MFKQREKKIQINTKIILHLQEYQKTNRAILASSSWNNFTERCCQHAQSVLPACDVNRQCNSKRIKQLYVSEKRSVLLQIPRLMLRKVNQTLNRNRGCFPLPTPSDQRPKSDAKFALLKKILKYFLPYTHTHTHLTVMCFCTEGDNLKIVLLSVLLS